MSRATCIGSICLMLMAAPAGAGTLEQAAVGAADLLEESLGWAEAEVMHAGMDGRRLYLKGDLRAARIGSSAAVLRDGPQIYSLDSPPLAVGREVMKLGEAVLERADTDMAFASVDSALADAARRGDRIKVRMGTRVALTPVLVRDDTGYLPPDAYGIMFQTLVTYQLKQRDWQVDTVELDPRAVDDAGVPLETPNVSAPLVMLAQQSRRPNGRIALVICVYHMREKSVGQIRTFMIDPIELFEPREPDESVDSAVAEQPASTTTAADTQVPAPADTAVPVVSPSTELGAGTVEPPVVSSVEPTPGVMRFSLHTAPTGLPGRPPRTPADEMLTELLCGRLFRRADAGVVGSLAVAVNETAESGVFELTLPAELESDAARLAEQLQSRTTDPLIRLLLEGPSTGAVFDSARGKIYVKSGLAREELMEVLADPMFALFGQDDSPDARFAAYRPVESPSNAFVLARNRAASSDPETWVLYVDPSADDRRRRFMNSLTDAYVYADSEFQEYRDSRAVSVSKPESLWCLVFNVHHKPLETSAVRRALAMTVNREALLQMMLNSRGQLAVGLLPQESRIAQPFLSHIPVRSVPSAKYLMKNIPVAALRLLAPWEDPAFELAAERIRADLGLLGIEVMIERAPWETYARRLEERDYDLALAVWQPMPPYRIWLKRKFGTDSRENISGYSNEPVDLLLTRSGDAGAAHDLIIADLPALPLFWLSHYMVWGSRVEAARVSPSPAAWPEAVILKPERPMTIDQGR